jgi:hypothetical protein
MQRILWIVLGLVVAMPSQALAQAVNFEQATTLLGTSCGEDIDANCRGVTLDPTRLKECLAHNQDVVSPKCQADYPKVFTAIQQRITVRRAVYKACERDAAKVCADAQDNSALLQCLIAAPRGLGWACKQAITAAGLK